MIVLALAWVAFLALWLLFVFQVSVSELIVGAAASAITVIAGCVTFRAVPACFEPKFRWVAQLWSIPAMVAADLWLLLQNLLREIARKPSRSSFQITPFRAIGENCQAASQRALATLLVSITPNSIVLAIDHQKGDILFHQLEPSPVPKILRRLEQ